MQKTEFTETGRRGRRPLRIIENRIHRNGTSLKVVVLYDLSKKDDIGTRLNVHVQDLPSNIAGISLHIFATQRIVKRSRRGRRPRRPVTR